jgi:hypothetical protein
MHARIGLQIAFFINAETSDSNTTMVNFSTKAITNIYGMMPAKGKCRLRSFGKR